MGARLWRRPWTDRTDQRSLRRKNRRRSALGTPVPERAVSFAHHADQLLPLLGNRAMDRLRPRALPPHERYSPVRFLKGSLLSGVGRIPLLVRRGMRPNRHIVNSFTRSKPWVFGSAGNLALK